METKTKAQLIFELETAQEQIKKLEYALKKQDSANDGGLEQGKCAETERLNLALEAAQAGTWEWNLRTNKNTWSDELWKLYGLDPHSCEPSYEAWRDTIHPEDRLQAEQAVQTAAQNMTGLKAEWRVAGKDGKIRWLMSRGKPILDDKGEAERFLGVVFDITDRKRAEDELQESEQRFSTAFFTSPISQSIIDPAKGEILAVNDACCHLFEYSREELIGADPAKLNLWQNPTDERAAVEELRRTSHLLPQETNARVKSGEIRTVIVAIEPISWKGALCLISSIVDITERKKVENALQESERRFVALFRSNPIPAGITHSPDYHIVDVNDAWSELTGYSRDEAIGHTTTELGLAAPDSLQKVRGILEAQKEIRQFEISLYTRFRQERRLLISSEPLELGGEIYMLNNLLDITERKQAEEKLREGEEQYRYLFENNPHPMWAYDLKTLKFLAVNDSAIEKYGYSRAEFLEMSIIDVRPAEDVERLMENIAQPRPSLQYSGEWRHRLKNGAVIDVEISSHTLNLSGHDAALVVALDITERKKAEKYLRESEERLRLTLRTTSDGFWIVDSNRRFVDVNEAYSEMSGYTREELLHLSITDIEVIESVTDTQNRIRKIIETGADRFETRHRRKDGGIFDVEVSVNLLDPERGLLICFCRDITVRKQAETLLKQRMEDLALINKLNDAVNRGESLIHITELLALDAKRMFGSQSASIYLLNPDKERLLLQHFTMPREYVEKLEKLIGRPAPQIDLPVGGDDHFSRALNSDDGFLITGFEGVCGWLADFINTSFLPSMVRPLIRKIIPSAARLLKIKSVISIPLKSGGETIGLIEFAAEGEFDESVFDRLQNVRHQLTEVIIRKRTEQSLRESNEKYRLLSEELEERVTQRTAEVQDLYENAPNGYHSIDSNGNFVMINQTELNWLGYAREELIGHDAEDVLTEKSCSIFRQVFPLFLQRGWIRDIELEFIRKDGSILPVSLSATALHDEAGNFVMSRSTIFDITERKKAEEALRASEAQLRQSRDELSIANVALEKAARMKDEFLASMSHELRTPLTGILGFSEALQLNTYGELNDKQKRILNSVHDSGHHLLALINDILDLSKIEAGKLEIQTSTSLLSDICQASLQLTKGMAYQKRQQVKYTAPVEPILLDVDTRRVKQIIVNLLSNAIKFTPENGELGLDVEPDKLKRQVRLIVWDKGIGIKPEHLPKLFQPFTQIDSGLAREYSGTGLGLSLVQRLVGLHDGSVEVESVFGKGSRFIVTLPWTPQTVEVGSSAAGDQEEARPRTVDANASFPMILVTDDNQVLLEMLTDFLEAKKYRTAKAQSGKELLENIEGIKPDVILMDIQMPGMDGLETIRRVRNHTDAAIATTIIIAVTALAMPGDRERCLEAGANEYMSKPVKLGELTKVLKDLLASSR